MEDEEDFLKPFDYINSDINLLALHILLEGFYRGQNVFTLDQFIKGNYWKIDAITEEIRDTQDYGSAEDLVLHQIIQILRDLKLGKIKRISLTDLYGLTEKVVREALDKKETNEEDVMYYTAMFREIQDLEVLRKELIEKKIAKGEKLRFDKKSINKVDFIENDFNRHIQYISFISAPFIEFEIDFNEEKFFELDKEIDDFVFNFYQDDYIEKVPLYLEKRYYFSKQLENFYDYIKNFPVVEGYVNIPFSALSEKGFEVVKILSYLGREKRIKVRNWNDKDLWNVKFNKIPITISSLLGLNDRDDIENNIKKSDEIKLNLSFSPQIATMILRSNKDKEYKIKVQGQVQKEVIRVIFQNPKNIYSDWSLYDIAELLGGNEVNEVAVKNAIYQFNRKVRISIPEVENIFELTKHSAKLNLKYVDKN